MTTSAPGQPSVPSRPLPPSGTSPRSNALPSSRRDRNPTRTVSSTSRANPTPHTVNRSRSPQKSIVSQTRPAAAGSIATRRERRLSTRRAAAIAPRSGSPSISSLSTLFPTVGRLVNLSLSLVLRPRLLVLSQAMLDILLLHLSTFVSIQRGLLGGT